MYRVIVYLGKEIGPSGGEGEDLVSCGPYSFGCSVLVFALCLHGGGCRPKSLITTAKRVGGAKEHACRCFESTFALAYFKKHNLGTCFPLRTALGPLGWVEEGEGGGETGQRVSPFHSQNRPGGRRT